MTPERLKELREACGVQPLGRTAQYVSECLDEIEQLQKMLDQALDDDEALCRGQDEQRAEIKRLRAALEKIAEGKQHEDGGMRVRYNAAELREIARAALTPNEEE
jgi:hypothetical protein